MGILEGLCRQQIVEDWVGAAAVVWPVVGALSGLDGVWVKAVLFLVMVDHVGSPLRLIDFIQQQIPDPVKLLLGMGHPGVQIQVPLQYFSPGRQVSYMEIEV